MLANCEAVTDAGPANVFGEELMDLQPERQNHSESTTQSGCLEREYAKDLLASLWLVNVDSKLLRYLHVLVMVKLFGWLCKAMTTAISNEGA